MNDGRQVVKQLDHLIARVDDPEPLFKLLTETFLSETGMLGVRQGDQVTIAPEKIHGLKVRLVE